MRDGTAGDAAMLIDADNLASSGVDEAFRQMAHRGWRVTLRRAYGGHEKLAAMKDCLLRHGVRAVVNHGRGTTDALLVVDAMDLLHAARLPQVVAIASSDADFAALALRLREAGCRVVCFAQAGKSADADLARCYDDLVYVDGGDVVNDAASRTAPAPRKTAARKKARPAPPPPADPLRQALDSIEGFADGRAVALNDVVKRLRDQALLGKSASGPAFLKKNAPYVELLPAQQPNKVRLKEAAG